MYGFCVFTRILPKKFKGSSISNLQIYLNKFSSTFVSVLSVRKYSSEWKHGAENAFAYKVVKKSLDEDLLHGTKIVKLPEELQVLKNAVGNIDPSKWKEISSKITANYESYSDEISVASMSIIKEYSNQEGFQTVLKVIDDHFAKRVSVTEPPLALAGCINMFHLGYAYKSSVVWQAFKRFCRRLNNLEKPQLLQIMFMVNICRRFPVQYSEYDVQHYLVSHFQHLTLEEMAVVAIAFFKSQTKLSHPVLMSIIMRKLEEEAATCESLCASALCKIIRYSLPLSLADELYVLQTKLIPKIPLMNLKCLTHVALSGTNVLVYHEDLIRTILDQFRDKLDQIRLKDIERTVFVMSLFNVKDDDFINRVISRLDFIDDEIQRHPKVLVCLTNYLVTMNQYNTSLINRVLSPRFLNETYDKTFKKIGPELIYIDKGVEIEVPEYKGNRLDNRMLKSSAKIAAFKTQSSSTATEKFSWNLEDVLKEILGNKSKVGFTSVLPQFHFPDFVFGFDSNLNAVDIPEGFAELRWGEIKHLPDKKNIWLVLIIGGWNTCIRNTGEPLGTMVTKMRQLRLLGYQPFIVNYNNWRKVIDKHSYLKQLIDSQLEEIKSKQSKCEKVN